MPFRQYLLISPLLRSMSARCEKVGRQKVVGPENLICGTEHLPGALGWKPDDERREYSADATESKH